MKQKSLLLAQSSALVCVCLGLTALETMFLSLIPLPIPGAKIGLSNLVILYCIGQRKLSLPWFLVFTRSAISALLFGNITGFLFSVTGGILSVLVMQICAPLLTKGFTFLSIGVAGSVSFQFGQSIAAFILYGTAVLYYTPLLIFFGTLSGAIIGLTQNLLFHRISKIQILHE